MTIQDIIFGALDTASAQLQGYYAWAPFALLIGLLFGGLGMAWRGAKWAPGLSALIFTAGGAWAGVYLANAIAIPPWIGGALLGLTAGGLGFALFRVWQALLLGTVLATAGISVYFVQSLAPAVDDWVTGGQPQETGIVIPEAGTVVGDDKPSAWQQTQSLWNHLAANVPNFQVSFTGIAGIPLLTGMIFGFLAPRFSRALWGASLGTFITGVAVTALLQQYWPSALNWLQADPFRGWGVVAIFWLLALVYNLFVLRRKKVAREDAEPATDADNAKAKPATT